MGILEYIKAPSAAEVEAEENKRASKRLSRMSRMSMPPPPLPIEDEKRNSSVPSISDIRASVAQFVASPPSISTKPGGNGGVIDDIKHEVMVNYLYQQQCSQLWVGDDSGELEGVLLRKVRGQYMACPPQLGVSPFAIACAALNVQVRHTATPSFDLKLTHI